VSERTPRWAEEGGAYITLPGTTRDDFAVKFSLGRRVPSKG